MWVQVVAMCNDAVLKNTVFGLLKLLGSLLTLRVTSLSGPIVRDEFNLSCDWFFYTWFTCTHFTMYALPAVSVFETTIPIAKYLCMVCFETFFSMFQTLLLQSIYSWAVYLK